MLKKMKKIENNELRNLLHNYLDLNVLEDGYTQFRRFTSGQMKQYEEDGKRIGKDLYARTLASSNIVLDFITDSDVLGIRYRWRTATGHDQAAFDFYVNGVFYGHHKTDDKAETIFAFDLPAGENRVTLFFPWQVSVEICNIILSTGASVKKIQKSRRILVLGDSISQGYICEHPSLSYVGYLTRKLDAECLNQAIGGYWFEKKSLDEELSRWKPDLILSAYGTNDYYLHDTKEPLERAVKEFLAKLNRIFPETPVLGIMPIPRYDTLYDAKRKTTDFSAEEAYDVVRASYHEYPTIEVLEDHFFPRHPDFFAPDLVHPNDLGFQIFGEAVLQKVQEIILKKVL